MAASVPIHTHGFAGLLTDLGAGSWSWAIFPSGKLDPRGSIVTDIAPSFEQARECADAYAKSLSAAEEAVEE